MQNSFKPGNCRSAIEFSAITDSRKFQKTGKLLKLSYAENLRLPRTPVFDRESNYFSKIYSFRILQKLLTIFRLTKTHALNLGKFVFSYKFLQGALSEIDGKKKEWHSFAAALVMGYYVFGENNAVNMQVSCVQRWSTEL